MFSKLKKKLNASVENESIEREQWQSHLDFIFSSFGYAIGLGNLWKFPSLVYNNGGGAFFIPYLVMLFLVGIPFFLLELSLGQFTNCGPATCWKFARIFRGIGVAMFVLSAYVSIYYNMIIAWSFFYLFASFTSELPWSSCRADWSSEYCLNNLPSYNKSYCMALGYTTEINGTCYSSDGKLRALYNEPIARFYEIRKTLPTKEYLENMVLGYKYGSSFENMGPPQIHLVVCYLLSWMCVAIKQSRPLKVSAKVVYFTVGFPYVIMIILMARGIMLKGSLVGIQFYIYPEIKMLHKIEVWKDAATHIFFSLSLSLGGWISLSSYNRFRNDVVRDSLIVALVNFLTSIFGGFVIFSYLGFLAEEMNVPIDEVVTKDSTLTFVIYPFAVTKLPASPVWSVLFFFMMILLGLDSQFVFVETCLLCITDSYPKTRKYRLLLVSTVCGIFFILGLPLTTNGAVFIVDMMHSYTGGWSLMFVGVSECIAVVYIYGVDRFMLDIETMVGKKVLYCIEWELMEHYCAACWGIITPVTTLVIAIWSMVDREAAPMYLKTADVIGGVMLLSVMMALILPGVMLLLTTSGPFKERIYKATNPTYDWGPLLVKHRALVAEYTPNFITNPDDLNETDIELNTKKAMYQKELQKLQDRYNINF